MSTSYIPHHDDVDGPHYAQWSAIFSKAGSLTSECGIIKELCEQRDLERLDKSVGYIVDFARTIAKTCRELQALSAAPAEKSGAP
jgi:hypothetical protein